MIFNTFTGISEKKIKKNREKKKNLNKRKLEQKNKLKKKRIKTKNNVYNMLILEGG
jgi:peroxiredoxin family protein